MHPAGLPGPTAGSAGRRAPEIRSYGGMIATVATRLKGIEDEWYDEPGLAAKLNRRSLLTGTVIGSVALWAGVWRIGATTVLFDEPVYASLGRDYLAGDSTVTVGHPPVVPYLFGSAQALLGDGVTAARVVSALASVVIALLLWRLGTAMSGPVTGVVAAALWVALPRSIGSSEAGTPGERLERFAYLEPVTVMFMLLALWFGWRLSRRVEWLDAIGLGVAIGLATGSKLSGAFVAVPAAVFLLAVHRLRMVGPLVAAGAASVVTFLVAYAPFGRDAGEAVSSMIEFQRDHAEAGHLVFVRGESTLHPPWYTELWYHFDAEGPWLTAAALGLVCLAFLDPRHRRAVVYCFVTVLGIYLCLSLLPVQIRHYRFVVWPPLLLLMAAGVTTAFSTIPKFWRVVGAMSLVVVVVAGTLSLVRLATLEPQDYSAVESELRERGFDTGARIELFGPLHVASHHLPGWNLSAGSDPVTAADADIVLVDSSYSVRRGEPTIVDASDSFTLGRLRVFVLKG